MQLLLEVLLWSHITRFEEQNVAATSVFYGRAAESKTKVAEDVATIHNM